MHFDQAANQSEPDAQPALSSAGRVLDLREHFKDTGQHIRQDADAAIADRDHYTVALAPRGEPDSSCGIGILGGIIEEVRNDLLQPYRIGFERERLRRQRDREMMAGVL